MRPVLTPASRRPTPNSTANASQASRSRCESTRCALARPHRCELDVTGVAARLAPGAAVTHGHALQRPVSAHQNRVADPLRINRDDLLAKVESVKDLIRQAADLVQDAPCASSISREATVYGLRLCGSVGFAVTTVRWPGQKPCLWYRPRCLGLAAKVKSPACRTSQRSNASRTAGAAGFRCRGPRTWGGR